MSRRRYEKWSVIEKHTPGRGIRKPKRLHVERLREARLQGSGFEQIRGGATYRPPVGSEHRLPCCLVCLRQLEAGW